MRIADFIAQIENVANEVDADRLIDVLDLRNVLLERSNDDAVFCLSLSFENFSRRSSFLSVTSRLTRSQGSMLAGHFSHAFMPKISLR